jgi:hypothetical protein
MQGRAGNGRPVHPSIKQGAEPDRGGITVFQRSSFRAAAAGKLGHSAVRGQTQMTAESYWAGLERVGWLAYVPAAQQAELRQRIAQSFAEGAKWTFLALSVLTFDGECIMGEGGPDEPLSYYAKLEEFAKASGGRFRPVKIVDRVDWARDTTQVSFAHNGLEYKWSRPLATDWFQEGVLDLVNSALKDAAVKERFIPLPAVDQCWHVVFVPTAVYRKAVRVGLIPTQEMVDGWPELQG